jgi:hypothetical protein
MTVSRIWTQWLPGLAAVGAGVAWFLSWLLNTLTRDNTVLVLGRSEGQYRSILNPALVLLLVVGLAILLLEWRGGSKRGALGAGFVTIGISAMLIGNLIEFGLDGTLGRDKDTGFAVFLAGYLALIPVGGLLLALGGTRSLTRLARAGACMLVGMPLMLASPILAHVLFAIAWALIGIGMGRRKTFGVHE